MPVRNLVRAGAALLLTAVMCLPASAAKKLVLVYTNSTNGNLDACACEKQPNGGLVKRAAALAEIRRNRAPVFVFDAGDLFSPENDPLLAGYVVKAYARMKYDGICPGDQEFASGIGVLMKYKDSLPFVCNNLRVDSGTGSKNPFRRTLLVSRGGIKIGVIGSAGPDCFKNLPRSIASKLRVAGWAGEISGDAALLRKSGADLVVLLSHSGFDADRKLAGKISGVDVIIGGHSQSLVNEPSRSGQCLVVQAGADGARIGVLEVELADGKISRYKNSFIQPTNRSRDDRAVRGLIEQYGREADKKYKGMKFD